MRCTKIRILVSYTGREKCFHPLLTEFLFKFKIVKFLNSVAYYHSGGKKKKKKNIVCLARCTIFFRLVLFGITKPYKINDRTYIYYYTFNNTHAYARVYICVLFAYNLCIHNSIYYIYSFESNV